MATKKSPTKPVDRRRVDPQVRRAVGNVIYAGNVNVEDIKVNRVLVIQFSSEDACKRAIDDGGCDFTFLDC